MDGGFRGRGRSHGGFKRRREDEQPMDPSRILLSALMSFGNNFMPVGATEKLHRSVGFLLGLAKNVQHTVLSNLFSSLQNLDLDEEVVTTMMRHIKRVARDAPTVDIRSMLINCSVQLPGKVSVYSLLLGLINAEDPMFVQSTVAQAAVELNDALQQPEMYRKARLLLRFYVALTVTGVLQAAPVVACLRALVDAAIALAETAEADDDGRLWQPYGDQLVYMALVSLPFGGSELADSVPTQLKELLDAAEAYVTKRPRSTQAGLRPFATAIKEDDPLAESDAGAASFLPEVVSAVREMLDGEQWLLQSVPRVHMGFEATLATAPQAHAVPVPTVPLTAPIHVPEGETDAVRAAAMLRTFPPRGVLRFLDAQHTLGDHLKVERIIAEDYILDTVAWFEGDRVECARQLAGNLPLPYPHEPLLCEVLFGQMMRLPSPEFKPVMYATLMVDLCKLRKLFPRAMSSCVRENFARMNVLDPALRERLAEWLAYHLSNFEYVWPWAKWEHVLHAPLYDGQRRFCVAVMNRMVRLSYWDKVQAVIPAEFAALLPPKPEVATLPPETDEEDIEGAWASKALVQVRAKASAEEMEAWMKENDLEAVLSGKVGMLRMLARCLLVAGAKSYTHMIIALERYYGPLALLVQETGPEGQLALVATAASVWERSPQRAIMAVDRMTTLRLVTVEAILSWVFGPDGLRRIGDQSRSGMAAELLCRAVNKALARVQDATEDLAAMRAAIHRTQDAIAAGHASQEDLDAVLAAAPEKESYLTEATEQADNAILQVIRSLVEAVSQGGFASATEEDDDFAGNGAMHDGMEISERSALREYVLASLRSFLREYNVPVARLSSRILNEILPSAPQRLCDLVNVHLRL